MIDRLKTWFEGHRPPEVHSTEPEIALTALLLEATNVDGSQDEAEMRVAKEILARECAGSDPDELIAKAKSRMTDHHDLVGFTKILKAQYPHEDRVVLMELLWEVAYADGKIDPMEDMLLRKLAGLLYIDDRERGLARQRVEAKLRLES